jgi:hypothetical protein
LIARAVSGSGYQGTFLNAVPGNEWLLREARGELVREYEAGYRRLPESGEEIEAALATAVCAVNLDTITTIPKRTLARRIALGLV